MSKKALKLVESAINDYQTGNFNSALEKVRKANEKSPDSAEPYHVWGLILYEQDQCDQAIELVQHAIELSPNSANYYNNLGLIFMKAKQFEASEANFHHAIKLNPRYSEAYMNLATLYRRLEQPQLSIKNYRLALKHNPNNRDAKLNLANLLLTIGENQTAVSIYMQLHEKEPENALLLNMIAKAFQQAGYNDKAETYYTKALDIEPENADILVNYANLLKDGEHDLVKSTEYTKRALEIDPEHSIALAFMAELYILKGKHQEALDLIYDKVIAGNHDPELVGTFVKLALKYNKGEKAAEILEKVFSQQDIGPYAERTLRFRAANVYDKLKQYEKSMENAHRANKLKPIKYDMNEDIDYLQTCMDIFTAEAFMNLPRSSCMSDKPVFIVGMPRSGTTLIEQIIDAHPQAHGAGELSQMGAMAYELCKSKSNSKFPTCMGNVTEQDIESLAKDYLDFINDLDPDAKHVVDKMPHNFKYVPLIKLMFPNSKIIHAVRSPEDTALSIYYQDFSGYHPYAYNLSNIGFHYGMYISLMKYWKDVLGIEIYDVSYEELVADQERVTRDLIAFLGLEWDENCLNFYQTERSVLTASHDQVRKPIYKSSSEKWKHYHKHMQPFIDTMKMITGDT